MVSDNNNELAEIKKDIAVILERTSVLPEMKRDIAKIKEDYASISTKVDHNKEDIDCLEKKSENWNLANSLMAVLAGIGAVISGLFGK